MVMFSGGVTLKRLNSDFSKMTLSRKIAKGEIGNAGYGFYADSPRVFESELDGVSKAINAELDTFPFPPKRVIFSAVSLNFCINQLVDSTTYLVEVEREYLLSTFLTLKNHLSNVVLLKPNKQDKMNYWEPGAIYVKELFKRSPVKKDGSIAIEKLIVDLIFDEDLSSLYSGRDIDEALEVLCTRYAVNYRKLFAYASRKGLKDRLLERIRRLIPDEILEVATDDKQTKFREESH